ncbi:hypothetical protein EYZ11_002795 [Aspergillus tanneri]|uniref:RED-like N-terminal domain-containing protein n=1 Tax=Aspergillus tanneri TaxID=1220188 RepID=A0A4S3JS25_9EURO|nr:hypothetical protein EYZ11_002795 [Aspergillus tanneri]
MNNQQFRRLVLDNPSKPARDVPRDASNTPTATSVGSRRHSSISMTPRSVTHVDFARQLAEHRETDQPPAKKFKSSAAPKGTKLPAGYEDRAARLRTTATATATDATDSDLQKRVQALEEMVKLGQIDQTTFEKLRRELGVGGDVGSTHMVKGLDWELLRRVRAGEDVSKNPAPPAASSNKEEEWNKGEEEVDIDKELERVLEGKGQTGLSLPSAPKEMKKEKKKGSMAPPRPARMSRDELLQQLRESRRATTTEEAQPESVLGARFKKLGETPKVEKKRWVEQDTSGRRKEILQITDAQGKTKRKMRWLDAPKDSSNVATAVPGLLVPNKDAQPLGMEIPVEIAAKAKAAEKQDEEEEDIFAGVGADYNPLGDLGEEDEEGSSDSDKDIPGAAISTTTAPQGTAVRPRNYFSTSTSDEPTEHIERSNPLATDPTLRAALKRAAALRPSEGGVEGTEEGEVDSETLLRRKRFLEEAQRREALDVMDMDLGFGSSRIEDEEDEEGITYEGRGGLKRKRGPKKRKGNKDSVSDVMQVLSGRQKE